VKVITEQYIRSLLKEKGLREFHVEHGLILSPAAKDYLNQERVRVCYDPPTGRVFVDISDGKRFVDAETGEGYDEKPESMTHLVGNMLVYKDHARIVFRGELDHLQSQIVLTQTSLFGKSPEKLLLDLENVLVFVRNLLRAEVLDEPVGDAQMLGLSSAELREQSHHPQEYFGVKAMTLPHYGMGEAYARLNLLRSQSRQAEIAAVHAFREEGTVSHQDILLALNRLSSGFHILCCRLLAGYYGDGGTGE